MKCTAFFFPLLWLHQAQQMVNMQAGFGADLLSGASRVSRADQTWRQAESHRPTCRGGSTGDSRLLPPADSLTGDKGHALKQKATLEPDPFPKLLVFLSSSNFRFISGRHDSARQLRE